MNWSQLFHSKPKAAPQTIREGRHSVRLLIITTDDGFFKRMEAVASDSGWHVQRANSLQEAENLLQLRSGPLVILDWERLAQDWRPDLARLTALNEDLCVFLVSRVLDDNLWQELIRHGGYDVLLRTAEPEEMRRDIAFAWFWMGRSNRELHPDREIKHS